ncbi:MAG: aminotransferase class I/II-fold pyridoxal phosphate-dependent enzyme [Verrucomicrobiales bacterium]|nr:aminotransferase class I/II-fold pyridoxal phosphate-dependent enzyme [Verrucomicrobiales bacterium]
MDGWSEDEWQNWITVRLREVLVRAYEGTRFYAESFRGAGFDPRTDFSGVAVLNQLPVLTKEMVRERGGEMVDARYARWSATAETSGTTGRPTTMRLNEGYMALDYACMYRMWEQAGYRFRDPFLALRSYVPSSAGGALWRHDWAQNTLFMSAYHFSPKTAPAYMEQILKFGPRFIRAYPSSLLVLAEFLERSGVKMDGVKGVFTASETLTEREREVIERVFGRVLYDWYGMTEPVMVAYEGVDHDGLRVVRAYGHAELLEGEGLEVGERRLVATSLQNPVMPFIRYETGDVVRLPAAEEGLFPTRFGGIKGRKDDVIVTPDGRRLPSVNFYSVFRSVPGIVRFQIVQYGTSDVVVNLESGERDLERSKVMEGVRRDLETRFGPEMKVEYRINGRFESSAEGKTPVILRRRAKKAVAEREAYALSSQTAWRRHRKGEAVWKLDWNEADVLPTDRVRRRLIELLEDPKTVIWYPEAEARELHEALARRHGVEPEQVLATHGSDMVLAALVDGFLNVGDRVLAVVPGYDQFRALAEQAGAVVEPFVFQGEGEFPLSELLRRVEDGGLRMVYLSNPNNPIGYHLGREMVGRLCDEVDRVGGLVVVDEAYAEFGPEDEVPLIERCKNLVVVRTFSKAFGLAGLRVGYAVADVGLRRTLAQVVNPKHLTTLAREAAMVALEDVDEVMAHVAEVREQRVRLLDFLRERGVKCWDSEGNFVLMRVEDPKKWVAELDAAGVLARDRSNQMEGTLRVTVGRKEAMDRLLVVMGRLADARTLVGEKR